LATDHVEEDTGANEKHHLWLGGVTGDPLPMKGGCFLAHPTWRATLATLIKQQKLKMLEKGGRKKTQVKIHEKRFPTENQASKLEDKETMKERRGGGVIKKGTGKRGGASVNGKGTGRERKTLRVTYKIYWVSFLQNLFYLKWDKGKHSGSEIVERIVLGSSRKKYLSL